MSFEKFDDNCPGCRPVILDPATGKRLPEDHPAMVKMMEAWAKTSFAQREAFHNVMCRNSRDPLDIFLVKAIMDKFQDKPQAKPHG